jgi:hypothetical protein
LSEFFQFADDSVEILDLGDDRVQVGLRKVYAFEERESVDNFICGVHLFSFRPAKYIKDLGGRDESRPYKSDARRSYIKLDTCRAATIFYR